MNIENTVERKNRLYLFLMIAGIVVTSFNLRAAITSVGPLLGIIREDVVLAGGSAGLLTSLPLIAFALMSPFAANIGNRFSYEGAMVIGLILLLIGMIIRSVSVVLLLFTGTLLIGLGIAILNVLLPGLIKDKFPLKIGLMTSIYSTTMGIVAAVASGTIIPLAVNFNLGWQLSLLIWALPAFIAIFIWVYIMKNSKKMNMNEDKEQLKYAHVSDKKIWRSPLAWQIASFMGLQSFLFYVSITWIPEILYHSGMSIESAGWMLSFMQFIGLPASFIIPVVAEKVKSQHIIVLVLALACFFGYGGLLISSKFIFLIISTALIGISLSGLFALALTLLGMRARTAKDAAELSGMAQSAGYILASAGPIAIGFLFDLSGNANLPIMTIMAVTLLVLFFGLQASRERYVYD